MIRKENIFPIGRISKHRGISGEVEIAFTDDVFDRGDSEYLIFQLDGLYVPFFWEEYKFKNNETAIFKFEEINTEQAAKKYVGTSVYYPSAHLNEDDMSELRSWKSLTGFNVSDEQGCPIGIIAYVDDSSSNIVLAIESPEREEILVPFHDDFLVAYDLKERTMQLRLPEGILSLNKP